MIRTLPALLLVGCAPQWEVDQANARARAMQARQEFLERRLHALEAEVAQRSATPPSAAAPPPPVEHVVVIRVERGDEVAAEVDLDVEPDVDTADDPDRRVPRIEDELISPWPRPRPDVGMLRIGSPGFYCAVSVDGVPVGNTPIAIRTVRTGPHEVSCVNRSLSFEETKQVTVERGVRAVVLFQRAAPAAR
jgi:hypothetical protein